MGSWTRKLAVLTLALAVSAAPWAVPTAVADSPRPPGPVALGNPDFSANVMAPLKVTDWADFEHDLAAVEAYGVDAVSVDVWWGDVEGRADNRFDWSYYDRVFRTITDAGLDIAPILSFHQCGGNVGDDYTSLLPSWLWEKYAGRSLGGVRIGPKGLQHRSEQGNWSPETVQGWADRLVANEYRDFTKAFTRHFQKRYGRDVVEINVSLGPSGELRYPSYNSHDTGSGYPTRGALQSYSPLAVKSLQRWAIDRYDSLRGVNRAWDTQFSSKRADPSPCRRGRVLRLRRLPAARATDATSSTGTTAHSSTTASGCSARWSGALGGRFRGPTSATRCRASTGRWATARRTRERPRSPPASSRPASTSPPGAPVTATRAS